MTMLKLVKIICIISISCHFIHYSLVQDGWIRLDLGFYMSSTWSRFSTSSQSKISLGNFVLSGRRYRDYLAPSEHSLPGRTWRQQAGFRRWLYYVVCQLVCDGMVTRFVIKSDGCGAHSNGVKGATQKFLHYFHFFDSFSYLIHNCK